MAIGKEIQAPNGATLSYWKVDTMDMNYPASTCRIMVSGYTDRTNRLSYMPSMTMGFVVRGNEFLAHYGSQALAAEGNNPVKASYEWLKTQPEFLGATDVMENQGEGQNQ
jgi:hypothetical protein